MDKQLCFFVCQNFSPEVSYVIENIGDPDVKVFSLPLNCSGPLLKPEKLTETINACANKYDKIVFLGSSCFTGMYRQKPASPNLGFLEFGQCFEILLNPETINHLIGQGYYLVSSGWFRNFHQHLKQWGFEPAMAKKFFRESAKKIMFLDTGIPGNEKDLLEELSEYMGLPYEVMPIGLEYCKLILSREIYNWKVDVEKRTTNEKLAKTNRQTADFSLAFAKINDLVSETDETAIAGKIVELINQLFAPKSVTYLPVWNKSVGTFDSTEAKKIVDPLQFKTIDSETNSFRIDLTNQNEILGFVEVEEVAFPQYLPQYKELLHIIGKVCGLAISNARKFQIILENDKQLENEARKLKQANATKDKFFSIIAHDLKSPFNTIIGFSDLLKDESYHHDAESIKEYSGLINTSATQTYRLLENLLDWARMQKDEMPFAPHDLNLKKILDEVYSLLLETSLQKSIQLVNNIPTEIEVFADGNMLKTILRNLVSNALKFTHSSGKIEVGVTLEEKYAVISVKDDGIGIKPEDINKIFQEETNHTTMGTWKEKGTGLGLMLCKEFAEKHGGKIRVESEVGKGCSFIFSIPLNQLYSSDNKK